MKICIDAGHYKNYNPGVVKGYYEGNIVWEIAKLQKKYLEEYKDVSVILTRSNISKDLSLASRGALANGCDLFLSDHTNACGTESVDRAVIIYPYDNKNKADVLGKKLGQAIQDVMGTKQKYEMMTRRLTSGGEYYGVMRAARSTGCPAYYIIEHGFHTNKTTCNWLLKYENLEKLAKKEVEVIANHYGLVKKSVASKPIVSTNSADSTNYTVKITADVLNVRAGAGTNYKITDQVKKGGVFTIIQEKSGWGKLKSGVGWISLKYTEKYNAGK